ncbi:MAG: methionine adenosyltransferase [Candidatus Aminicenantes bacterium]|nr:methionine adenosyltransferase [Candidatus Aminicenantes bacterium]TFG54923.1 MAG: methionine adenosyltransferase [Candidatus Aminicenantes bacterium]
MAKNFVFTSESVSEGHPDKMADLISDAFLDAILAKDPFGKVACETLVTKNVAVIAGEFRTNAKIDPVSIVRETAREIGYDDPLIGFDAATCEVHTYLGQQSADIARGVDQANGEVGAGDQGLMFGYATNETPELMPLPIRLAHRLVQKQAEVRKSGRLPWLRPDAKSQVSIRYKDKRPVAVEKVVLSTQHSRDVENKEIYESVVAEIIEKVIPIELRSKTIEYLVNPTGRFEIGGPVGDTGLTGRKIIVDTYGGSCPHGGGAFSGKDPTKVDRSAAYAARYIAKNIVAAGLANHCTVQLAYVIGVVEPFSLMVNIHSGGKVSEGAIVKAVRSIFQLTPAGMIKMLDLRRPIYKQTAAYGHFGRELPDFTWEKTDKVAELKAYFGYTSLEAGRPYPVV